MEEGRKEGRGRVGGRREEGRRKAGQPKSLRNWPVRSKVSDLWRAGGSPGVSHEVGKRGPAAGLRVLALARRTGVVFTGRGG